MMMKNLVFVFVLASCASVEEFQMGIGGIGAEIGKGLNKTATDVGTGLNNVAMAINETAKSQGAVAMAINETAKSHGAVAKSLDAAGGKFGGWLFAAAMAFKAVDIAYQEFSKSQTATSPGVASAKSAPANGRCTSLRPATKTGPFAFGKC